MTPMEAWSIISKNLKQLYSVRDRLGIKPYTDDEIQAKVMCFRAIVEMQNKEDDCK